MVWVFPLSHMLSGTQYSMTALYICSLLHEFLCKQMDASCVPPPDGLKANSFPCCRDFKVFLRQTCEFGLYKLY